jgi:hypothetical protein
MFPKIQPNTRLTRSNPAVQGRAVRIKLITGVGNMNNEGPKSRLKSLPQNEIY